MSQYPPQLSPQTPSPPGPACVQCAAAISALAATLRANDRRQPSVSPEVSAAAPGGNARQLARQSSSFEYCWWLVVHAAWIAVQYSAHVGGPGAGGPSAAAPPDPHAAPADTQTAASKRRSAVARLDGAAMDPSSLSDP